MNQSVKTVRNAARLWFIKWDATASSWPVQTSRTAVTRKLSLKKSALNAQLVKKAKSSSVNLNETEYSTAANAILNVISYLGIVQSAETALNVNTISSKRKKVKKHKLNVQTVITQKTQANKRTPYPVRYGVLFCEWIIFGSQCQSNLFD